MSLRRHILQVVALVTAVALVFGAFAGAASAKKLNKAQKAKVRAELRKSVKKNPGVVKRRSFLKKAALVNFKLPVTIRLRNPCSTSQNASAVTTAGGSPLANPGGVIPTALNCVNQGTALNQLGVPNAKINLGPSLGSREVSLSGALAAVVEFADTYDGGALGNVNIKILPGNKTLRTSSVPLLWNSDIAGGTGTRADANFAKSALGLINSPTNTYSASNPGEQGDFNTFATTANQGCDNWTSTVGGGPGFAPNIVTSGVIPDTYKSLFYNSGYSFLSQAGIPGGPYTNAGAPGYAVYTLGGLATQTSEYFLPVFPGGDNPNNIRAGGVTGNNDYIGTNPNPFPIGSAPVSSGGNPTNGGLYPTSSQNNFGVYNAANTVLRTNALSLGIAAGGTSVNMSTGTQANVGTVGGLTTAQGSNNITMGYSGGQANLFGNIPGKNVGIDVTVNLATKINAIARIMDQDVFKQNTLVAGNNWPATIFSCRQIFTGAVQNYIPGVRLTGSLRIAPAITKDGKVRIAKATVTSDASNPDRVALSACLFPSKPYNKYTTGNSDASNVKLPASVAAVATPPFPNMSGGPNNYGPILAEGNTRAPLYDAERYPPVSNAGSTGPDQVPCGSDGTGNNGITPFASDDLASIIRDSSLTETVSGLPQIGDPAFTGYEVTASGAQASVAGDITVGNVDVDVLLGDQPIGS